MQILYRCDTAAAAAAVVELRWCVAWYNVYQVPILSYDSGCVRRAVEMLNPMRDEIGGVYQGGKKGRHL